MRNWATMVNPTQDHVDVGVTHEQVEVTVVQDPRRVAAVARVSQVAISLLSRSSAPARTGLSAVGRQRRSSAAADVVDRADCVRGSCRAHVRGIPIMSLAAASPGESSEPSWRRASRCSSNGCVEIAVVAGQIAVRDSKHAESPVLLYTSEEWQVFIDGVKDGEFDLG
jgi:hypothetical protein